MKLVSPKRSAGGFIPGNEDLLDYQYFIADHLPARRLGGGNARSVIREQRIYEYLATMETENAVAAV